MTIKQILIDLQDEKNLDDPDWLSKTAIHLAVLMFEHNSDVAKARKEEDQTFLIELAQAKSANEKLTIAEADRRAVDKTENLHEMLKLQSEAIKESIQAIKKRLEYLMLEIQSQPK